MDLMRNQLQIQEKAQQAELELRRRAQDADIELRRLALDRADENEKAANQRLAEADRARIEFARRGQTFAMCLAAGLAIPLIAGGLLCIFLAVANVIATSVGLGGGSLLLAAGLVAGIADLIGRFLPPGNGPTSTPSG